MKKIIILSCIIFMMVTSCATISEFNYGNYEIANKSDVENALQNNNAIVLDARSNAAFSGWITSKNKLGGHITGTTDFSANWLKCSFDDKNNFSQMSREKHLEKYIKDKKLSSNSSVIIYDETGRDAVKVADYLLSKGIKKIKIFNLNEWKKPLKKYNNYQLCVPPGIVKDLIDGKKIKEIGAIKDLKILTVGAGDINSSGYSKGHIPTSLFVNVTDFDNAENSLLKSDLELIDLAKSLGINVNSTVVCTGLSFFAYRYATILKYLGVKNVFVMTGGQIQSWLDAGFKLEVGINKPTPIKNFGAEAPLNKNIIDTVNEIESQLKQKNFTLVDARTVEEHTGKITGAPYVKKAGNIKGAIFSCTGINTPASMLYYQNLDGTMRNADEILKMWKDQGIDVTKHLSFHCTSGYRAAEIFWYSKVMGLKSSSLFSDSWCGWTLKNK